MHKRLYWLIAGALVDSLHVIANLELVDAQQIVGKTQGCHITPQVCNSSKVFLVEVTLSLLMPYLL